MCVHVVSQLLVAKHVPGFICKASIMWYAAYALLGERYVTGIREREKERERVRERERELKVVLREVVGSYLTAI